MYQLNFHCQKRGEGTRGPSTFHFLYKSQWPGIHSKKKKSINGVSEARVSPRRWKFSKWKFLAGENLGGQKHLLFIMQETESKEDFKWQVLSSIFMWGVGILVELLSRQLVTSPSKPSTLETMGFCPGGFITQNMIKICLIFIQKLRNMV
jgi:hypothetical protein